jgi:phage antirepressor YoqD-like protein
MKELIPVEYQNQRVLTTQLLAESYETETIKIQQNFKNNEKRYLKGKHYFLLEGEELRTFKDYLENFELVDKRAPSLYLWTEYGALLHAKSLNTDIAWKVYEGLVDNYFRTRQPTHQIPQTYSAALRLAAEQAEMIEAKDRTIAELTPMAEFASKLLKSKDSLLVREYAKIMFEEEVITFGEKKLYSWFRENGYLMKNNEPYQAFMQYFEVVERSVDTPFGERLTKTTKINPKGQLYFYHKLKNRDTGDFKLVSTN